MLGLPKLSFDPVLFLAPFLGGFRDYSGDGRHATQAGAGLHWQSIGGVDGLAAKSTGRLVVPNDPTLEAMTDLTFFAAGSFPDAAVTRYLLSKRDAGGTQAEIFIDSTLRVRLADGVNTRAANVASWAGVGSFAVTLTSGAAADLFLSGAFHTAFNDVSTITGYSADLTLLNLYTGSIPAISPSRVLLLYPGVLPAPEIAQLHAYSQSLITPRRQWPGSGLRYPGRGDPYTPITGDPTYLDNLQTARVSVANETSGRLSNTTYQIESGTWKVSEDATAGERYIECIVAGIISRRNLFAYGTWELKVRAIDTSTFRVVPIANQISGTAAPGYRLDLLATEAITIIEQGFGPHMTTDPAYLVANTIYNLRLTRSAGSVFTLYIKGGAFTNWTLVDAAAGGTNPFTDASVAASKYLLLELAAGDRLYADRQFAGVLPPL